MRHTVQSKPRLLSGTAPPRCPSAGEQPCRDLPLVMTKRMGKMDYHGYRKDHKSEQRSTLDVQRTFFPLTAFLGKRISLRDGLAHPAVLTNAGCGDKQKHDLPYGITGCISYCDSF